MKYHFYFIAQNTDRAFVILSDPLSAQMNCSWKTLWANVRKWRREEKRGSRRKFHGQK